MRSVFLVAKLTMALIFFFDFRDHWGLWQNLNHQTPKCKPHILKTSPSPNGTYVHQITIPYCNSHFHTFHSVDDALEMFGRNTNCMLRLGSDCRCQCGWLVVFCLRIILSSPRITHTIDFIQTKINVHFNRVERRESVCCVCFRESEMWNAMINDIKSIHIRNELNEK